MLEFCADEMASGGSDATYGMKGGKTGDSILRSGSQSRKSLWGEAFEDELRIMEVSSEALGMGNDL